MSGALLRRVYDAAGQRDWTTVESLCSDDLVITEPASLPFGGEYRGRDALLRLFIIVMDYWDNPKVTVNNVIGDDVDAAVLLTFTMTSKHTGRTFTQSVAETAKSKDGLVTEMRIHYFDTAEVAREAGPKRVSP